MAIFGNLNDMPLPDVLSTVGHKTGRFTLWNTPSQHYYELHISDGLLTGLMVNNEAVEEIFPLRNRIAELMSLKSGEFEFEALAARLLLSNHQLSIDTLLLSGLSVLNEVAEHRSQLPNPQTIFRAKSNKDPWLTGDLLDFWQLTGHLLAEGASAESLSKKTGLYEEQVLLSLYKLRTAGLIIPVRAFEYHANMRSTSSAFSHMTQLPEFDKCFEKSSRDETNAQPLNPPPEMSTGILQRIMLRLRKGFSGNL